MLFFQPKAGQTHQALIWPCSSVVCTEIVKVTGSYPVEVRKYLFRLFLHLLRLHDDHILFNNYTFYACDTPKNLVARNVAPCVRAFMFVQFFNNRVYSIRYWFLLNPTPPDPPPSAVPNSFGFSFLFLTVPTSRKNVRTE